MINDLAPVEASSLPLVPWRPGLRLAPRDGRADLLRLGCAPGDLDAMADALADALAPDGPRLRVEVGPGAWPAAVDVAALVAGGVVECSVDTSGWTEVDWVHFVATLVAAREHGLAPEWTATATRPGWVRADVLHPLAPPGRTEDPSSADLDAWTAAHRYGSFHWRRGPGFVVVADARGADVTRWVIDDERLLSLFLALANPVGVHTLPAPWRDGVAELAGAGLVLAEAGLAVRLPYRLRHRPMPGNRV